jgi:ATP-dependent Lon protease
MPLPGQRKLVLTGQMGPVLRESARTVLAHMRGAARAYGLDPAALAHGLHVHAPEAAVPKDGPSAGLALCVAIASAARGRAARADVALTGEVTLTGRVLAVGGVRAKLLAAARAGIAVVVLPESNRSDVADDAPVAVVYVTSVAQALDAAFATPGDGADGDDRARPAAPARAPRSA